ncbi:L-aspartate oxidase [Austwickia chelonae]|uniref:L-aspartate oxidase n=1 Tax=Austwickia chelonae NBRC 105200 TaxID=1184607 RepID=K6V5U0_9MICO|nr:L-aspartate oxidase [Austwickia chelonae]GAB77573.1 L-aspartate oxidase [Austwickia chelonae NBRC 105200]SEW13210.1 L-aspartate oxidase [Austwickia chelonae]
MMSTAPAAVIVGSGLAGLVTALELARPCVVVTAGTFASECSSDLAQGGIAAVVGPDDDIDLHVQDTLTAGAGLCEPDVVRRIVSCGPQVVDYLQRLGVPFDRSPDGMLILGLEGAHCRRRIVHVDGDSTGHAVTAAVARAVRTAPWITVLEHTRARRLLWDTDGVVDGVVVEGAASGTIPAGQIVLATGGIGGLFARTTNPRASWGSGLALGLRAGALAQDLEMVQFHPTALAVGTDPMPLVSEAVRGDGARLIDERGRHLLEDDLAPRDIVSRAVADRLDQGGTVYLDTPAAYGESFSRRFPTVAAQCAAAGLDPATAPLPVCPAAHYHMGGLAVDGDGRTTVPGLWAVGEVAATGLHGANRLASNSLLEAVVTARATASALRARIDLDTRRRSSPSASRTSRFVLHEGSGPESSRCGRSGPDEEMRRLMDRHCGVLRDEQRLHTALSSLGPGALHDDAHLVALMILWSALSRTESRGAHRRIDCSGSGAPAHTLFTAAEVLARIEVAAAQNRSA